MVGKDLFFFNRNELVRIAEMHQEQYLRAKPFPSIVIDDFFPRAVADQIHADFPKSDYAGFKQPDNTFQKGKLSRAQDAYFEGLPLFIRHILNECNSLAFIDFMETLTGIQGLIPDPHFNGGAVHQILPGGKLAIHADFNKDRYRKLDRRVNVILYFNKDWRDEYGGHLELWDRKMSQCVRRIAPVLNRCVVFNTGSHTFHGHPDPLRCPDGMTRKSIALYYYTNGRGDDDQAEHSTLWRARPGTHEPEGQGNEVEGSGSRGSLKGSLDVLKLFVPPIMVDVAKALRRRV